MPYLKFYRKERLEFPEECQLKLKDSDAVKIARKIARHFKFDLRKLSFRGHRQTGNAYTLRRRISISHNPNIELLCHELAHLANNQKFGNTNHNKKLMSTIRRFIHYCRKMSFWGITPEPKQSVKKL